MQGEIDAGVEITFIGAAEEEADARLKKADKPLRVVGNMPRWRRRWRRLIRAWRRSSRRRQKPPPGGGGS